MELIQMSRKILLCSFLGLGVFATHSTAHADLLAITTDFGITATRDHSNLVSDVNEVTFGDGVDVRAKINSLNELCYGTSINAAADVRQITNITNGCCGATFGPPPGTITAIGVAEGNHFVLGGDWVAALRNRWKTPSGLKARVEAQLPYSTMASRSAGRA